MKTTKNSYFIEFKVENIFGAPHYFTFFTTFYLTNEMINEPLFFEEAFIEECKNYLISEGYDKDVVEHSKLTIKSIQLINSEVSEYGNK